MSYFNSETCYGSVTKFFHWTLAFLVIVMLIVGALMDDIDNEKFKMVVYTVHKSTGLLILVFSVLAFVWHWVNPLPVAPDSMPLAQRVLAKLVHLLLYGLLIAMSLVGLMMSIAAGYPPKFFWLFTVTLPIEKSESLAKLLAGYHNKLAWAILVVAAGHILAALAHHFYYKDNVLKRMLCNHFQGNEENK